MNFHTELVTEGTVYNSTCFKEINSDGFFHVLEHCLDYFLYWPLCQELFLYLKVSVFSLHKRSFQLRLVLANTCLTHLLTYFTHSFVNFTWFTLLGHQRFDDRSLFKRGTLFQLLPFWIASKQILKQSTNTEQCRVYIYGKKNSEKFVLRFPKNPLYLLNNLHIYIYISEN